MSNAYDLDQSKPMFTKSFHSQMGSVSGKKQALIDTITNKIYEKHKNVISYKKVKIFTEHALRNKQSIDSTDLTMIESKI